MRKTIKITVGLLSAVVTVLMATVCYFDDRLPDCFYLLPDATLSLRQYPMLEATETESDAAPVAASFDTGGQEVRTVNIRLFGVVPLKTAAVRTVSERYLVPCGTPFGLKLLTKGVVIVGLNPVETANGTVYPAVAGDLKKGDIILTVGGAKVSSNKELSAQIQKSGGAPIEVEILRDGVTMKKMLQPMLSRSESRYQCGIWVRDSSAGIGTLTFYDPTTGAFGGLGHAVCDTDTGQPMPLGSGDIVSAAISGIKKGSAGAPGELQGSFLTPYALGTLDRNDETGVYGTLSRCPTKEEAVPIALKQEIREGPAEICTTISGTTPQRFAIEIERVDLKSGAATKNMIIRVTDPALLEKTGGIVQGMSGSPIIQDGKLIGAVTHVLVNDPTRGYGIFIENMLGTAG